MVYPRMGQMRLGYLTGQMLPGLARAFGPGLPGPAGQQRPGSSRSSVGARCQDTGPEPSGCGLAGRQRPRDGAACQVTDNAQRDADPDQTGQEATRQAPSAGGYGCYSVGRRQGVRPRIRLIACADSSDFTKNPAAGLSAISSA
jgi:hypothetical protein